MAKSISARVAAPKDGVPTAHSRSWDAALDKALAQASRRLGTGTYRINVEFWGDAEVTNPGQIWPTAVTITRQDGKG